MTDTSPPYQLGVDFILGERIDLTHCDCHDCRQFRRQLIARDHA